VSLNSSPRELLFGTHLMPRVLPTCEHLAGNEKFIAKALQLQQALKGSFDITCDLEDGAPVGDEPAYLKAIIEVMRGAPQNARLGIRLHHTSHTHFQSELETVVDQIGDRVAYITIPKARSAEEIREVARRLNELTVLRGISRRIPLHVLIETPRALREVFQIAEIEQVETLDFGLMDYISEHHGAISANCMRSPHQFEHALLVRARTEIAAAALGALKVANQNVCVALGSPSSARDDARRARLEFGFQRMWSIHPAQIEPILEGMSETVDEVERAQEIILRANNERWGPISLKNQLHDRASYRYYWLVLERARMAGVKLADELLSLMAG
jgi:citrate lyase subunit beta/citryl-CoA lyase